MDARRVFFLNKNACAYPSDWKDIWDVQFEGLSIPLMVN